ncbi:MAG TPA: nucleoside monophosphate kinase [Candidatus Peribacteraceae bacterium]|nr:nucleoside monophosphate kinase [Candidatus Peribacteraceae bacterium]
MDLVLFGIQGSGKGTQAKKLAEEFNYSIFETGAELRKIAASGTELGNIIKSYIDAGNLAPLDIVMEVVKQAILAKPADQKLLFDGIPRDLEQMKSFNTIMREVGRDFRCVQLTLDDDTAFKRIQGRALQEGRADDANEEAIRRRMNIFKERTLPVIESYRTDGNMTDIDGGRSIDEVYEDLKSVVAA